MLVRIVLLVTALLVVVPDAAPAQSNPDGFDLQGHRGARGLAPENTIPSFRRALELGVTTLEMDVVISEDGKVVVSHEPWMNPAICSLPSGAPVPADEAKEHNLYRMPYVEIEQYDCGRRQHPDFPRQETQPAVKPLLRDVIAMAESYTTDHDRPPIFYNVEIKSNPEWDGHFQPKPRAFARKVLKIVHDMNVEARSTIQSFDPRILRAVHSLRAESGYASPVRIALLVGSGSADALPGQLEDLGFTPAVYSPRHTIVNEALLRAAHDRGLRVVPWTVNERGDMRRLVRLGVDGLITDYPDVAQEVLDAKEGSSD